MSGFLNVYKPKGLSSAKVVGRVKFLTRQKVGHLGTLDPLAEGVLPIALGKATRLFDFFLNKDKLYVAKAKFGFITDTLDLGGTIVDQNPVIPTEAQIKEVLPRFKGKIMQLPPNFSAKNVNGKKAYDLARLGIEFALEPKQIEVFDLKLLSFNGDEAEFEIHCSAGTYVRSLVRDIAEAVGALATTTSIIRLKSGVFDLKSAISFEDLDENLEKSVISIKEALSGVEHFNLNKEQLLRLNTGLSVQVEGVEKKYPLLFIAPDDKVFGLGEIERGVIKIKSYLYE